MTATNGTGSTIVSSAPTSVVTYIPTSNGLSWYRCGAWGGTGVYEDAACSKKGASNSYRWLRPPSSVPFTTSNSLKGELQSYAIKFTVAGTALEVICKGGQGEGTLVNAESRAEIEDYKPTLSSCTMQTPQCTIPNGKIVFNALKATSPQSPETLNQELKFVPKEGTTFTTFELTGCAYSGTYKLVGSFKAKMHNDASWFGGTISEMWEAGTLRVGSAVGPKAGITGVDVISSEGKPVKLDTGP